jgi:hypothetical protein
MSTPNIIVGLWHEPPDVQHRLVDKQTVWSIRWANREVDMVIMMGNSKCLNSITFMVYVMSFTVRKHSIRVC